MTQPTAVQLRELVEKLPTMATLEAVDDDAMSGRRPCPITLSIADVRTLHLVLAALTPKPSTPQAPEFQRGVEQWMDQCFVPSLYSNMTERGDRLLEEVLELLQAHDYDPARVATLVQYVWSRPKGGPAQEVGGVMVTLAGFCWIAGLDMHAEGDRELARITQPEVMAKIRAKQEAKNALRFDTPLPGSTPQAESVPVVGVLESLRNLRKAIDASSQPAAYWDIAEAVDGWIRSAMDGEPTPARPTPQADGDWRIDMTAGRPILVYQNCSVIEDEQARYVLGLIAASKAPAEVTGMFKDENALAEWLESLHECGSDGAIGSRKWGPAQRAAAAIRTAALRPTSTTRADGEKSL